MKRIREMIVLGIMAVMMFALSGCGKTTVNLDKYVTITAEGYDSVGTASVVFDYDAFAKDYSQKIKVSKDKNEIDRWKAFLGEPTDKLFLDMCVSCRLDKTADLCNGDIITLKWTCEDEMAKEYFNADLKYSDIKYIVKDLKKVEKFDPFAYVSVSFSGISPEGSVEIAPDYDQPEIQYLTFSADKSKKIKNGDTVTVTASITGSTEKFIEKFGCVLSKKEKTYPCDSLDCYISDVNEIPADVMDEMKTEGETVFRDYVAKRWDKPENLLSVSYVGNYFLTYKGSGSPYFANNGIYLLYAIRAINPDPEQEINFYYYMRFDNLIRLSDGTCTVDLDNYCSPSNGWWSGAESFKVGRYLYYGFKDVDSFYNEMIVSKIEGYQYTTTVKKNTI